MNTVDIKRKFNIEKLHFPVDNIYNFYAQVLISVDNENYYYCGIGKFCRTEADAQKYIEEYQISHQ
ncbi:MAG TPA: hypothetical protein VIK86_07905 [Candidatus Paceibacterota bacterium]